MGENEHEITITYNWVNCLIGDEQEPHDFELGKDLGEIGSSIKYYLDWFLKNVLPPS